MAKRLSRKEALAATQRWRETFAIRLFRATGRWCSDSDANTFPGTVARYASNANAQAEYERAPARSLVVRSDDVTADFIECVDGMKPPFSEFAGHDLIINPPDCAWTLLTSHDDWTYFAYREWVTDD